MKQLNADDKEWARKKLDADFKWRNRSLHSRAQAMEADKKRKDEAERKKRFRKRIVIAIIAYLIYLFWWKNFR